MLIKSVGAGLSVCPCLVFCPPTLSFPLFVVKKSVSDHYYNKQELFDAISSLD